MTVGLDYPRPEEARHAAKTPKDIGDLIVERVRLAAMRALGGEHSAGNARRLAAIMADLETGAAGRLRRRIRDIFRLTAEEMDLLDLCLAIHLDPSLHADLVYADGASRPAPVGPLLAARLFGHARPLLVGPKTAIAAWSLVEPSGFQMTGADHAIDTSIASALLGEPAIDARIAFLAEPWTEDMPPLAQWGLERSAERIAALLEQGLPVRLIVRTSSARSGLMLAQAVARTLGTRILRAALPAELAIAERADLFMRIQRIAVIAGYVPCWTAAPSPWPAHLPGSLLQFVLARPGEAIDGVTGTRDLELRMPTLSPADRRTLLLDAVPAAGTWEREALEELARNGAASYDDIAAMAAEAVATPAEAAAVLRHRIVERIGAAGVMLQKPYQWAHLVLPERVLTLLRQIPFEIRNRERLAESVADEMRPLYDRIATSALFCGASGTGKTMAAQVIARDLGTDLIRVDLAGTVSKYIGETAKNLRRIFDQVAGTGAILMFDEADALFARRTEIKDAHDRHANADTNYLLQLIESFDGAVLLATNKRDNIDPAFMRRLRHVIEFPAPGPAERARLWSAHVGQFGGATGDPQLSRLVGELAASVDLSPAQIKNAAVTAAYAAIGRDADAISAGDLMVGVERELGKDGRALAPRERDRLGRSAGASGGNADVRL